MPIATRPPEAHTGSTPFEFDPMRLGDEPTLGVSPPSPGALLPTGDSRSSASALTPSRALALDARRLLRMMRDPARRPLAWAAPAFGLEVRLVLGHLAPLQTRAALAGSYGREAFHDVVASDPVGGATAAVRLAYALRWSELGLGDGRAADRAAAITSPCGTSARSPRPRPRRHRWRSPSRGTGPAT